jgi:hypothetical protein
MVGGRIDAVLSDPRHPGAIELYTAVMYWRQRPYIEVGHFSTTANLFTLRRVFDDVGPFDDSLKSGGDAIWGQQVFAAGYRQTYADDACVEHPTMSSWRELFSRTTRQAGGVRDIKRRSGAPYLAIKRERPGDLKLFAMQAGWILSDPRPRSLIDRLKTLGVLVMVAHFVLIERLRLRLGGTSKR